MKKVFLLVVGLLSVAAQAAPGPQHKTLRAYAMGNAFVAVSDDKDAMYYNPAGLWLINRLGNYDKTPELGYYPHNYIDMRLNLGGSLPVNQAYNIYKLAMDFKDVYDRGVEGGGDLDSNRNTLLDTLANHGELADGLNRYDRLPVPMGAKMDAELAFHGFGGSIWIDGGVAPYIDGGIITPSVGIDTLYIDVVSQASLGFAVTDQLLLGAGYKALKREYFHKDHEVSLLEWKETSQEVEDEVKRAQDNALDFGTIDHGMDLGAMYLLTRELRLGASLRNVFFTGISGQSVTPNLTMGVAASPRKLQRNTAFSRKVNFAADFEDMLNNERNYKFFSHLNFGMEIEQVLLAVPVNWLQGLNALKGRLGVGFKGGYLSAGGALEVMRVITLEGATWAEEAGYYTGQEENRYWVWQISMGF